MLHPPPGAVILGFEGGVLLDFYYMELLHIRKSEKYKFWLSKEVFLKFRVAVLFRRPNCKLNRFHMVAKTQEIVQKNKKR